jgi:hypothetical protein
MQSGSNSHPSGPAPWPLTVKSSRQGTRSVMPTTQPAGAIPANAPVYLKNQMHHQDQGTRAMGRQHWHAIDNTLSLDSGVKSHPPPLTFCSHKPNNSSLEPVQLITKKSARFNFFSPSIMGRVLFD